LPDYIHGSNKPMVYDLIQAITRGNRFLHFLLYFGMLSPNDKGFDIFDVLVHWSFPPQPMARLIALMSRCDDGL
jgi:hypothetical protein